MKEKWKSIAKRIGKDIRHYGWAAVVFAAYYIITHLVRAAFCPLLQMTGLPCAGCGLTRAFLFVARGQFARAFYIQPFVYPIMLFLLYCGFCRYVKGSKVKGFQPMFILLVCGMLIFYIIRMYLYFPDRVPYVYQTDNTLANRFPIYTDWMNKGIAALRSLRGY